MKKEKENVAINENSNKSLMRKTKAELVDIIFRKDAVEKDLRGTAKNLVDKLVAAEEQCTAVKACHELLLKDYNALTVDYQDKCDEHISCLTESRIVINKYKLITMVSWIITLLMVLLFILL